MKLISGGEMNGGKRNESWVEVKGGAGGASSGDDEDGDVQEKDSDSDHLLVKGKMSGGRTCSSQQRCSA